jgi:hypothetical protein
LVLIENNNIIFFLITFVDEKQIWVLQGEKSQGPR